MKPSIVKLIQILNKKEKIDSIILLIFFIIVSIFESITLLLISKLVYLIQGSNLKKSEYLYYAFEYTTKYFNINFSLFTFTSIIFIILFTLKTILYLILSKRQSEFIFQTQANISQRIFKKYFEKDYLNYKKHNSSIIIRNLTTEVSQFVQLLQSLIVGLNEFLIIISLMIVLMVQDFQSTLILIILILSPTLIYRHFTKNKILLWGKSRQFFEGKKIQIIQESHGLLKELIIYNKINYVHQNYSNVVNQSAQSGLKQYYNQQIPKYFLEFFSIISLFIIGIVLFSKGVQIDSIFSIISLLVASSFKLIPSVNRLIGSFQNFKYCTPTIDTIHVILFENTLQESETKQSTEIKFKEMIGAINLNFNYGNDKLNNLNFNFTIYKGQKIGIVGESGSGKSTFIDLLLGLIKPKSGNFIIDNKSYSLYQNINWYNKIGYVPQDIYLINDTIKKNIALHVNENLIEDIYVHSAIKFAKLEKFVSTIDNGIDFTITENGANLSGGQKQRIGIARAIYRKPEILILDEATSALNEELEKEILNDILNLNKELTIIMITHRKNSLINCDRIFEINNNKLVSIK
jgi:ABC-type multidrug transport system fused ATPase/permease subunit